MDQDPRRSPSPCRADLHLSFCVGRAVRGGSYGDYPDLASLDRNGNMKYTVDFRSLYATVLDRWLGRASSGSPTGVLR